ncbi:DegV family protein [Chloroflexota bacterium]
MTIKIVTDSSCDLPAELVQELGITVVPLYARFGEEVYREQVEISLDEFYRRLEQGRVHPVTIQPSPQDFVTAYQKVTPEADGILSIHISSKLSGTYNSAVQGRETVGTECPIEVIDSQMVTVGLGLVCVAAAKMAQAGEDLATVAKEARRMITDIHLLCLLDTLKYLALGGRIGKAKALLGSVLNVKPMITLREGEVVPAGQVRSRSKGIERLSSFVESATSIDDLAIAYNTTPDEARALAERLSSLVKQEVRLVRLGTTLGVHMGPGALAVGFIGKKPV